VIAHGELNWIHHWLSGPVAAPAEVVHGSGFMTIEWLLIALGSAIAIGGVGFAWRAYSRHGLAFDESISRRFGFLYGWWKGKYFFDEFYERTVVRAVVGGAEKVFAPFDYYFVDGIVNGVGKVTRGTGQLLRYLQTGLVQSYAAAIVLGVVLVVAIMLFG
jgi:NADH-quinone oxidoreductase subunit L